MQKIENNDRVQIRLEFAKYIMEFAKKFNLTKTDLLYSMGVINEIIADALDEGFKNGESKSHNSDSGQTEKDFANSVGSNTESPEPS